MGAWGQGTFDNDGALDFLGELVELAGLSWTEGGQLVGEVAGDRVDARLVEVLNNVATSPDHVVDQLGDEAYAALGLLAFALSDPQPTVQQYSSLDVGGSGQPDDPLGLGYGLQYLRVMTRERALALLPLTAAVIEALFAEDSIWASRWTDEQGLNERRRMLERVLGG